MFTDIEGSTQRSDRFGDAMRVAIERHAIEAGAATLTAEGAAWSDDQAVDEALKI